jgi:hypothetical protein
MSSSLLLISVLSNPIAYSIFSTSTKMSKPGPRERVQKSHPGSRRVLASTVHPLLHPTTYHLPPSRYNGSSVDKICLECLSDVVASPPPLLSSPSSLSSRSSTVFSSSASRPRRFVICSYLQEACSLIFYLLSTEDRVGPVPADVGHEHAAAGSHRRRGRPRCHRQGREACSHVRSGRRPRAPPRLGWKRDQGRRGGAFRWRFRLDDRR